MLILHPQKKSKIGQKSSRKRLNLGFAAVFLLLLTACQKKTTPQLPPAPVTAIHIQPRTLPADFEYVGVAESSHIVELRARVEGYLEKIAYQEGGLVRAGDLMFVLDQRPFIASLDSAEGALSREKAVLWNAKQTKTRMIPLYQQNAVSQRDMDNAIADEFAAEANVMTANANVLTAKLNLGFASISSPVTGMANQAKFREGALISPGPNSLLTTIYVIDPIWVNFSVSSGDILKARDEVAKNLLRYPDKMNFNIEVQMADSSIIPATGKIDFTDPALQQNTGTMLVRSVLPNPKTLLRPGQFVRVIVKGATRPNAIAVPQTAVLQGQSGMYVYTVDSQGKAAVRPVIAGDWYKDFWIINSGLKKGDIVIVEGVNKVQNGTPVSIKKWIVDFPDQESNPRSEQDNLGF